MSSPNYDHLAHLKIPLESILSATNNFDEENSIGEADFVNHYKGQLLWSGELIKIHAQRWPNKEWDDEKEQQFWMEISLLSTLKHKNLVSLVGFCDENGEKIIIIKHETRGSLSQYLSDSMLLTWERRLEISVGIVQALSYIHYDQPRDFSIIHRLISSSRVLLNDDWEPKLSCFECSMKIEASKKHNSFHTENPVYVIGYGDPTYIETKSVNHKSDIYSFGIVLFELLCGRKSLSDNQDNKYLAPMAIFHYKKKILDDIIDPDLLKQMDPQSFNVFAKTAYDCLSEERSRRPDISEVVTRLEKALELQFARENWLEHSIVAAKVESASSNHDKESVSFISTDVESHLSKKTMSSPKDLSHLKVNAEDILSATKLHQIRSKEFAHLKVPLENILSATNNFDEENVVFEDSCEQRYKGQLLWSSELIKIDARRFTKKWDDKMKQQFWMEISMLSSLKHKNVVSLVGFCDENHEKIIIIRRETKGCLENYLSDSTRLTWVRRLEICVGLAHALSYIHYDESRDFSVIHRNISSNSVLLNKYWEPILCEFQHSMKIKASERHDAFHTDSVWSMKGYTDPTYLETRSVNHKSDIYSFGIVLFELLCGRKSVIDGQDNKYLAPAAILHYKEEKLDEIIDCDLWKHMDLQSFKVFAETAYECLNEEQSQRPNMDQIVTRLEKALELQLERGNILTLKEQSIVEGSSSHIHREFQHLKIELEDIKSATNGFDDSHCIGKGGFGKVYEGELVHSKGQSVVAMKRLNRAFGQGDAEFWKEIIMLSLYRHENIVSLLGFCDDCGEKILVYEYASKKSLDLYIKDKDLTWVQRLEISIGAARGLAYLHNPGKSQQRVLHRDIKSSNILLDENWNARIADLGLSKFGPANQQYTFLVSNTVGTFGYCDPLYIETGLLTKESDVYSFGVVLFELLCGRLCIGSNNDKPQPLTVLVRKCYKQKTFDDIIFGNIKDEINPHSLNAFTTIAYQCLMREQEQRPLMTLVVRELERALKLQGPVSIKLSAGLKLSEEDILSEMNKFSHENFIKNFRFGRIYKGQIMHSEQLIDTIAKVFSSRNEIDISKAFWTEISMLSSLKHKNLVSVIGFNDDEVKSKVIIYKKEDNGSLKNHLSDKTFTWMQRLKVCVAVANALSYIHYDVGRDFSVIHCNIKSSNILLDDKWEPKLSSFELSLKNTLARRHRLLLTRDIVKNVYLDPKYKKTGGVTHKSDVYSFGVVLFEVLCGRSAVDEDELGEGLLAKSCLDDMINPHLRKQMDPEAFKIFSETAFYCLQEERAKRPHIDQVVNRLEKALQLQWKHENPVDSASSNHLNLKEKNLEHLKIGLDDINEATKNFDDAYCIGSGGFGKVYKADLEHFDNSNSFSIEGVNKCDLPRKRSTVAIKRIYNQEGEQGFIAEIETLTSCKHENIISLLGFCSEGNGAMILVYEHASKGSLENYLGSSEKLINLTWVQRLNVCLDIAHGLNYIHNNTDHGKQKMTHRDIKSDNILLGDNWKAKIADFGLSKFHPAHQAASTIYTDTVAGTYVYLDPEYQMDGKLNKKSDIYSFGVVLLEILTGTLAYDSVYTKVNAKGIAPIARDHFEKGTVMEIVDHKIKEETNENVFSLSEGPNKESLDIFLEIAYRCVAETQARRPTIEVVINELKKALNSQENHKCNLKLSLEDIKLATKGFSQDNIIGHGDSGNVYKGATHSSHGDNIIAAKRLDKKSDQGDAEVLAELATFKFMAELDILMEYKHLNVIGLVGYCDEEDEKVIVYEYASRGSLDKYLSDDSLTWVMRLKICIDIATGLEFLHGTVSSPDMVTHRDISSSNILLFDDWKAKITGFGLSIVCPTNHYVDYVIDNVTGKIGYCDPLYSKTGFLTKESDIFSLGAVLFDVLCGKLSSEKLDDEYLYLPFLAKHHYHVGKLDKLVFEGIKEQILPQSYTAFTRIALQCLHHRRERRPTADEVVIQLKKALEFQEDDEIWERKLPKDYKEIVQMSKCPDDYSTIKKEDLYNNFSKGILLQQDKVLLSFDGDRERNEMVSATIFSYIDNCPHEWKSLRESRFGTVVEMLDISDLNIEIKTRAQFLSPNVVYGVYLVFKFCDSRNFLSKPVYVNLKYRKEHKSLNAYFATWRDEHWMMIELHRFSNQNEDVVFEFLLESFSSYYCGDAAVYVEGIEFRAIDKVNHEEIGKMKEVQQVLKSDFNVGQAQQLPTNFEEIFKICRNYDDLFWLGEVEGKKLLVLSAKAALYKFSNVDIFTAKPPAQSRFKEVIELLPQQVFHLKCTIKSQMLSPVMEYVCYLVFKLSEKCQGLHFPVKVQDVLHKENNEAEFVYFITPSPSNINDITRVPKQREDGWMEIQLWKFNSTHEFKDDSLSIHMKFTSHEGIMSGLIVCGLEFRPMFSGNSDGIQRQREKKRMLRDEAQNPHIQPKKTRR